MTHSKKSRFPGLSPVAARVASAIISDMPSKTATLLPREALEKIARVFRVFSEATRLQILQELKAGPRNVTALVEAMDVSQANISKQLRILSDAGIIKRSRLGTQAIYAIADPLTFELCNLVCEKLNREASAPQPTFSL